MEVPTASGSHCLELTAKETKETIYTEQTVFREEGGREGRREEKRKLIEKERKGKRYKLLLKLVLKGKNGFIRIQKSM